MAAMPLAAAWMTIMVRASCCGARYGRATEPVPDPVPDPESTGMPAASASSAVMRDDVPDQGLPLEVALENAGQTEGRFFRVPSILGDGGAA